MVINCKHVSKSYGSKNIINDITLHIQEQTISGLIGRNGAGKTTLLKMIAGFWRSSKGSLQVFEKNPFDNLTVSANTIFIDDRMVFPETLTLERILTESGKFYRNWDARLAERLFDYFNFDTNDFHRHLSKGKKSTFNMIVGLASRSPLTIFDEPTTGMDQSVRKDFYRALLKDYLAYPRTIIISSHHLDEIEDLLENVLLIDEGKLIFHIPIDEMREHAIGITGDYSQLDAWSRHAEVLHKEKIGVDNMYLVVKNTISQAELIQKGFTISAVSCSDLAVYMTQKSKGGIDDVFHE